MSDSPPTTEDKALVLDKIIAWHENMQLQGEGIAHSLDRMLWMLENTDREYDDFDCCTDECCGCGFHECCPMKEESA